MNLLPNTEKNFLKKGLRLRFLVVLMFLLASSFFIGFVTLLPAYFLTSRNVSLSRPVDLGMIKTNLEEEILNLPEEINSKLKFLQSNIPLMSPAEYIARVVEKSGPKITLNSISFLRESNYKEKKGILISVEGVAIDRDSLILFGSSLKEAKSFSSVDIPVSNLTKDKNLPFTMNIFIEN